MGFLDGISNSLKKIMDAGQVEAGKTPSAGQETGNPEEIDVFGQDLNGDGIGDNLQLRSENLLEDEYGNTYIEVDKTNNNSLYKIMSNAYEGFDDMSSEEQKVLMDAVMEANPEIYGTEVNNVSNQYVTDNTRGSINKTGGNRTERMNTVIYAGDKIYIPTKDSTIESVKVKTPAENGNEGDSEHVHVGTVIATPHGSKSYTYTPESSSAAINESSTLSDIVKENFKDANEDNTYSIALNQAKANSDFVLERINAQNGT